GTEPDHGHARPAGPPAPRGRGRHLGRGLERRTGHPHHLRARRGGGERHARGARRRRGRRRRQGTGRRRQLRPRRTHRPPAAGRRRATRPAMNATRRAGFTLLEVTAVVLLTGILVWFTTDFYLDLSRQSRAAVDTARHTRRAVVLLDRIARDLESAVLVRKPGPVDPLLHPWLFLAESDDPSTGAQRLKFSSRGRRPRSPQA